MKMVDDFAIGVACHVDGPTRRNRLANMETDQGHVIVLVKPMPAPQIMRSSAVAVLPPLA